MTQGRFVVIEGIDGSGTSTQARAVAGGLTAAGRRAHLTHEPTEAELGRLIRRHLSGEIPALADPAAQKRLLALLFAADRQDHLGRADGIAARLAAGEDVVCARYVLSSLAYEGGSADEQAFVETLNRAFAVPHLTVYLDCPIDTALARMTATRTRLDVFENRASLEAVRAGYDRCLAAWPGRLLRVDATRDAAALTREILAALS